MSVARERIEKAYKWVMANRPKVNGYPYLAEALRQAGVVRYVYQLPSNQCIFFTKDGNVVSPAEGSVSGLGDVPRFDRDAFIKVLRLSQAGDSTFPEFLRDSWKTGVITYEADLLARKVTYHGADGETYIEEFPAVEVRM